MKKKNLIIISIIAILLVILLALAIFVGKDRLAKKTDEISGYSYVENDLLLDLKSDGSFRYYQDKNKLTDSYYEGTYKVYNGEDAIKFITNDLKDFGITEKEQRDLLDRNSEYMLNNYYCLVLENNKCIINGKNTLTKPVETPYIGFYLKDTDTLNLTNISSANVYNFVKQK